MGKCPNCGRATARTKDWACQWCGYPLVSGFYRKIPKTFRQLKGEEPHEPESSAGEETEASILPNHVPLMPTHTAESEPISEPEQVQEPEQVPEPEPEPIPEPKQVLESKAEQVQEPEPEPIPAAKETTVEQLISAYEVDEAAADAEFVGKILKLTGVVTKIEASDTLDVHYIVLTSAEEKGPQSVRCLFDKKYGAQLNRLTKEQTVTVQGKYNGSIIAMRMIDCVLGR
jgi:hypothetical protein